MARRTQALDSYDQVASPPGTDYLGVSGTGQSIGPPSSPLIDVIGLFGPTAPYGFNFKGAASRLPWTMERLKQEYGPAGATNLVLGLYGASQEREAQRRQEESQKELVPDWLRYQEQNAASEQLAERNPWYQFHEMYGTADPEKLASIQRLEAQKTLTDFEKNKLANLRATLYSGGLASEQSEAQASQFERLKREHPEYAKYLAFLQLAQAKGRRGYPPGSGGYPPYGMTEKEAESGAERIKKDLERHPSEAGAQLIHEVFSLAFGTKAKPGWVLTWRSNPPQTQVEVDQKIQELSEMRKELAPLIAGKIKSSESVREGAKGPSPSYKLIPMDPNVVTTAKHLDAALAQEEDALAKYKDYAFQSKGMKTARSIGGGIVGGIAWPYQRAPMVAYPASAYAVSKVPAAGRAVKKLIGGKATKTVANQAAKEAIKEATAKVESGVAAKSGEELLEKEIISHPGAIAKLWEKIPGGPKTKAAMLIAFLSAAAWHYGKKSLVKPQTAQESSKVISDLNDYYRKTGTPTLQEYVKQLNDLKDLAEIERTIARQKQAFVNYYLSEYPYEDPKQAIQEASDEFDESLRESLGGY